MTDAWLPNGGYAAQQLETSLTSGGFRMLLIVLLVVSVMLIGYLLYALVKPEAFQ